MSQRNNFAGGFLLGTLIGATVGGIVGVLLANRQNKTVLEEGEQSLSFSDANTGNLFDTEANIELARRRLEDKIAQLNVAIDDVRHQLGNVNGVVVETTEENHS
jgi:gas vesicle protein